MDIYALFKVCMHHNPVSIHEITYEYNKLTNKNISHCWNISKIKYQIVKRDNIYDLFIFPEKNTNGNYISMLSSRDIVSKKC
jgi:hypothetical protein